MERCYAREITEFPNEDAFLDWLDQLRLFNERHSLRRALAGARVPSVMLGINHGRGEISFSSNNVTPKGIELWGSLICPRLDVRV